ncbi:MAG: hypothetical protein WC456_00420 [Patescibacteria group bacterium]
MPEYLQDKKILEELEAFADLMVEQDLVGDSITLAHLIEGFFKEYPEFFKKNPDLFKSYGSYLTKAKFVHLFNLEDKDIVDLLNNHLSLILDSLNYDLFNKIRQKLLTIYDLAERDKLKDKMRDCILKNSEKITTGKIKINNLEQEPTIGNWAKDYYSYVGIESADSLLQNQYLVDNINVKKISSKEKIRVKKIIDCLERFKLSSAQRHGLEESFPAISPNGELIIISNAQPQKVDPNIIKFYKKAALISGGELQDESAFAKKLGSETGAAVRSSMSSSVAKPAPAPLAELEQALKNYQESSLEHKAIKQEINRLKVAAFKQAQKPLPKTNVKS